MKRSIGDVVNSLGDKVLAILTVTWGPDGTIEVPPSCDSFGAGCFVEDGLEDLEFGHIYWICLAEPATLFLAPAEHGTDGDLR